MVAFFLRGQLMRHLIIATMIVLLMCARLATAQSPARPQTVPQLRNHHVLLVLPGTETGEPFFIAVAPDGQLSIQPVSQLQPKMAQGYRPFTFGELQDAISQLMNQNAALDAELKKLRTDQSARSPLPAYSLPAQPAPDYAAQQAAAAHAQAQAAQMQAQQQAEARRQQRQAAIMFLLGRQPQTLNMKVNVTDCSKSPALCVH